MDETRVLDTLFDMIKNYRDVPDDGSFLTYKDPAALSDILDLDADHGEEDWSGLLQWIEKYFAFCVRTHHKGFVNRMWVGANLPSIMGEMVSAVSNTSSCTFESAPVSTLMEKYMIQQMLDLVGFKNGEGQMATGSSNANMMAMMIARNHFLPAVKSKGFLNQPRMVGFISADAHYSMEKAANIIGIGTENLIRIPVDATGEMDITVLKQTLEKVAGEDAIPFFVGATAGTTVRGAYDSIPELLKLKAQYPFWLHVDGAWGGAVLVSTDLKERFMNGIEQVDSLTWDFHKMLGTSLICNIFMVNNHPRAFGKTFTSGDDSYLFHTDKDSSAQNAVQDLGSVSLQCGRRVESLKWFLDWKYFGRNGFARRVENALEMCRYAEAVVNGSEDLELYWPRNSFNICFRYKAPESISNRLNLAIRERLYHQGESLVGYANDNGRIFFRLLLAGPDHTQADVDAFFDSLIKTGTALTSQYP